MSMRKYDNFCKALKNLKECQKYQEPYSTVTETGLVALFEICFEQAWKTMKACLQEHGYEEGRTGSPKRVIKVAYQAGMIQDDTKWLGALETRNEVAHSYNEEIALQIIRKTKSEYLELFEMLQKELADRWI